MGSQGREISIEMYIEISIEMYLPSQREDSLKYQCGSGA